MNSANSTTTSSIHLEDWEKQSYAKWIELENKIKHLNKTLATLKDMQKTIECNLINAEEDNNTHNNHTTQVALNNWFSIGGNRLKFTQKHTPEPLTFKFLERALSDVVKDPNQREQLIAHLKNKRNIKTTTELKLFDPPQSKQNQNS